MISIQVSIEANENDQEILISQLSELGAEGFEQTDDYLLAYFNENMFKSYEINDVLKHYAFTLHTVGEKNWNQEWESNFEPVLVDQFCAIRAEFHQPATGVEHEIIITPKMSFGTGHHATTYMMIEQMRSLDFRDRTVFDFGTGTGILSILAEKLGASKIEAIDVDEWSIANAHENILKNTCSKITVNLTSKIPQEPFDIVLANINRNVILAYLPELAANLKENCYLLLSGLLARDENDILEACEKENLRSVKQAHRDNWIALLFIKWS